MRRPESHAYRYPYRLLPQCLPPRAPSARPPDRRHGSREQVAGWRSGLAGRHPWKSV